MLNRVGRLKGLGNMVVPQQFYPVLLAVAEIEMKLKEGVHAQELQGFDELDSTLKERYR